MPGYTLNTIVEPEEVFLSPPYVTLQGLTPEFWVNVVFNGKEQLEDEKVIVYVLSAVSTLEEGKNTDVKIKFVEVKTGDSGLSRAEQGVKSAIENNRVSWEEFRAK